MNGQVYGEDSSMKNAIVHFSKNLLNDDHPQRPQHDEIFYDTISMEDAIVLEKDFSEEEVNIAINDLGTEKAPAQMVSISLSFRVVGK